MRSSAAFRLDQPDMWRPARQHNSAVCRSDPPGIVEVPAEPSAAAARNSAACRPDRPDMSLSPQVSRHSSAACRFVRGQAATGRVGCTGRSGINPGIGAIRPGRAKADTQVKFGNAPQMPVPGGQSHDGEPRREMRRCRRGRSCRTGNWAAFRIAMADKPVFRRRRKCIRRRNRPRSSRGRNPRARFRETAG